MDKYLSYRNKINSLDDFEWFVYEVLKKDKIFKKNGCVMGIKSGNKEYIIFSIENIHTRKLEVYIIEKLIYSEKKILFLELNCSDIKLKNLVDQILFFNDGISYLKNKWKSGIEELKNNNNLNSRMQLEILKDMNLIVNKQDYIIEELKKNNFK